MISVVLVNWNGWADTIACIQSLLNSKPTPVRIIVVDNQSKDNSMQAFECWTNGQLELIPQGDEIEHLALDGAKQARHIKFGRYIESKNSFDGFDDGKEQLVGAEPVVYIVDSGRNGGFGFGCNVGMRLGHLLGSCGYWLLNNDCVVNPDVLGLLVKSIEKQPRVVFGTVLRYYFHPERIQAMGGGYFNRITGGVKTATTLKEARLLSFINGASMIVSDQCYKELGGFDEAIFMYFEENDFCIRAANAGYRFDIIKSDVFHKHGGSQGGGASASAWMNVLINKHYVLQKHFGWGAWTVVFYTTLILRCLFPFTGKNASMGARRALKVLMSKGAPQ